MPGRGFVLGVGFCEEGIKAMPVIWRMYRPSYLSWHGACLLGMASGAGFGVSEGIHYSTNYYNGLSGAEEYVLRFTSVAGLHVLLSGACGILLHRHQRHLDEGSDWADWWMLSSRVPFQKASRKVSDWARALESCRPLTAMRAQENAETPARRRRTSSSMGEPWRMTST